MSKDIRIRKGLDINLVGAAEQTTSKAVTSNVYALNLDDFHGITPKMLLKQGEEVKAGEPLFYNKNKEEMHFVSPVSGELVEIVRGARRKILTLKILADKTQDYVVNKVPDLDTAEAPAIKNFLLQCGGWPFIKQRPYDVIADPDVTPKAIFISAYATAPLAADVDYVLKDKEQELQVAVTALGKLTPGKIHVSVGRSNRSPFMDIKGIEIHKVSGPHPSGLVGTQINQIDPVNKGEVVWTISPQDLLILGELLLTGKFNAERTIALAGSIIKSPKYYTTKIGAEISTFLYASGVKEDRFRLINGDVLTGKKTHTEGHLGFYNNTVTAIPEGDDYDLFGWNKPIFNKVSTTRALTFSWLQPKKKYDLNTNTNGEHRAFVVTGQYEEVFPMDIYPLQLLKACMVKDLDEMEQLGLYEVAPEDFSLTEFICISKQPHQQIIREGLDLLQKELG
ncbi:Na+-transporting NADH:ubiquinone oxidoreductase subunit A [Flagellimonas taeanensis]|jgi:Na+-transporting NADH:ubiquinone oxidoreductase subunit A|uniref:Na(+)-translocating NADH-quinone reductase subunit A n=1 Tax=Flagellimonas taeanensis TaxID=1005926 RepID=A0A1M6U0L5_9FLAO|nr:Na(+)-translocating NADH-quinone reductase subunit A [Allomuricauda taeanensis]MEE1962406.1 Na(+)-translocating NADH-quinone reductase subunit A [Allomuricauda taeanensis]SFB91631.1 Na+-transporting NADH:ubiquinone oxidoreductase subunit A [Allomuricauda taeanensis]SHK62618.1 Na+-transporting NADH:ubiquinone oxidoreductase subunit A [Allomuricauda taeanensis]